MQNNDIISFLKSPEIRSVFHENHNEKAYLIGSFSRGESTNKSDIDIMYVRPTRFPFTLFNIGNLKSRLEASTGRSVDLISERALRTNMRENITKDQVLLFG